MRWNKRENPPKKDMDKLILVVSGHHPVMRHYVLENEIVLSDENGYDAKNDKFYINGLGEQDDYKVVAWMECPKYA